MADNSYYDDKLHTAVKFGDRFDTRTVEGRKRAMRKAIQARRATAEIQALRAEEQSWSFWWIIFDPFGRG